MRPRVEAGEKLEWAHPWITRSACTDRRAADREGDPLNRFVFRKSEPAPENDLPPELLPLARLRIRICTFGYPKTGSVYYEGTVRDFVVEHLPHQTLIEQLPILLTEQRFSYQPGSEKLMVERLDAS
jgi:hypothetical protein